MQNAYIWYDKDIKRLMSSLYFKKLIQMDKENCKIPAGE